MKKVLALTFFVFSSVIIAEDSITKVDRESLYNNYKPPQYRLPIEKLSGLNFEQSVKYLKMDIYDHAVKMYDDHRVRTKSAMTLIQPEKTKGTISRLVDTLVPDEAHLQNPELEKMINKAANDQMAWVVGASKDPAVTFTNDLYVEIVELKATIDQLKEERSNLILSQAGKTNSKDTSTLFILAVGMTFFAIFLNFIKFKKLR